MVVSILRKHNIANVLHRTLSRPYKQASTAAKYYILIFIVTAVSKDGETIIQNDMTYSLRHVEESWIHLLKAGEPTEEQYRS